MQTKTALITGASQGLGKELAIVFARNGYNVVIIARHKDALEEVAHELSQNYKTEVTVLPHDLSKTNAAEEIVKYLQEKQIEIDILVNNAGFGNYGYFWETDLDEEEGLIQVNITSLVTLTKLLLPKMIAKDEGKILNVASVAAFMAGPMTPLYYASKAFVLSFSQGLSEQLRDTHVTCTVVCPGPTKTHFRWHGEDDKPRKVKLPFEGGMKAAVVAEIAYDGLMSSKQVVIPGFINQAIVAIVHFLPRALVARIVGRGQMYTG